MYKGYNADGDRKVINTNQPCEGYPTSLETVSSFKATVVQRDLSIFCQIELKLVWLRSIVELYK